MLIAVHDAWKYAVGPHRTHVLTKINTWLDNSVNGVRVGGEILLESLLEKHSDALSTGTPEKMRAAIKCADILLGIQSEEERRTLHAALSEAGKSSATLPPTQRTAWEFMRAARSIFNYKHFSEKSTPGWNAYALCTTFDYRLCPYCQQAFAFTLKRGPKGKGFRPTLDHFYPKSTYPYLGLSLYNLIPSCQTCNSSLKGSTDFAALEHLHPYEDSEHIRFKIDPRLYLQRRTTGKGKLLPVIVKDGLSAKAINSNDTFLLEERYRLNAEELTGWVDVLQHVSSEEIAWFAQHRHLSPALAEAILLQFNPANYRREMLGKMKKDIMDTLRSLD